jgi:hypothetical protein
MELARKIEKGRFNLTQFSNGVNIRIPEMWEAALAA